MRKLLFCIIICVAGVVTAAAQTLSGKIVLPGSEDAPIATIRIPDQSIATTAKVDGSYLLTGIKPGKHVVEYSYVGYRTETRELTFDNGEAKQLDVVMEEAPIMLGTVFVTPDGSDAARFILNKVWENADRKYKAAGNFSFATSTVLSCQDLDVVDLLPTSIKRLMYMMAGLKGFKTVLKLLVSYPKIDVQTTNSGTCTKGKYRWGKEKVTKCSVSLSNKEREALDKLKIDDNLYDQVYVDNILRSKKTKVQLKGSYQDGDRFIYIIEGQRGSEKAVMHVVEDTWDVVKYIRQESVEKQIWELRESVGKLYMPVSYNETLIFMKMTKEELRKMKEQYESDSIAQNPAKKGSRMAERMAGRLMADEDWRQRAAVFAQRINDRGMKSCVNRGVAISYRR